MSKIGETIRNHTKDIVDNTRHSLGKISKERLLVVTSMSLLAQAVFSACAGNTVIAVVPMSPSNGLDSSPISEPTPTNITPSLTLTLAPTVHPTNTATSTALPFEKQEFTPTDPPEPTQVPPTNTPQPTNTPKPPTKTPVPPEQPKAPDWWTTEGLREEWVNNINITDEQDNPDGLPTDRDLLREYVNTLLEYQNNSPSAIDPMFSVVSYPKAADPNPVMALLSNNNLKKISMHGAGGIFNDPSQRRVELDIDSEAGYSLSARKIINAAGLAKEAWHIKWLLAEYKPNMTTAQVQALVDKVDKQTHALTLSILKYWSENHPDTGVRAELEWYYTEWIKNNSLTQLTKPRTNGEFATALQTLYSRNSIDSLNGLQPKDVDIQGEIDKLRRQIAGARNPQTANRLHLKLLSLQNSLRV